MAAVLDQPFHVRSVSMPSRPQPIVLEMEDVLKNLRTCVALTSSARPQTICSALRELGIAYESIQMILHLPSSQQDLCHNRQKKWVEKELEQSIKVLDLCTLMRENLVAMKEHSEDLALALRRKDPFPESKLQAYTRSHKKSQKEIKNCFKDLKQTDNTVKSISTLEKDSDVSVTVKMLIETREIINSVLLTIFSSLSYSKSERKGSKWGFVAKALRHRKVACGGDLEDRHDAQSLGDLENGLNCLFKRLILNRVSLLNIISL